MQMAHIIVNVGTNKPFERRGDYSFARYTERGAKSLCTKMNKQYGNTAQWVVWEEAAWREANPVKMVTRVNLMSGLEYQEAEDTPCFMSPSCESYWSM
jgi:hypothetical protein